MNVLHTVLCAALAVACLYRWRYVSEGTWDRKLAYAAILFGCSLSLLRHVGGGELLSMSGMAYLIFAGAVREHRAECETRRETVGVKPRHVKEGRAA